VRPTPVWVRGVATALSASAILSGALGCPRIVLSTDSHVDADVYALDPFLTTGQDVADLRARGHRAFCRLEAGVWEPARPDAARFDAAVLGAATGAVDGSRWLDTRRWTALAPILADRLMLCRVKGFDGVLAEHADGYARPTGFPIDLSAQRSFNRAFAAVARSNGLRVGLAAEPALASTLAADFDFTVGDAGSEGRSTTSGS